MTTKTKALERELEECRAVMSDMLESRGLPPLWQVYFSMREAGAEGVMPSAAVLRAVNMKVAKALTIDHVAFGARRDFGLGMNLDYDVTIIRLVDRASGVLDETSEYWEGTLSVDTSDGAGEIHE